MVKNHLKRIATPKTWSFLRKKHMFITKPAPGAHAKTHATSVNSALKELMEKATTTKEVKRMLKEREVLVDGKRRHDEKHNIGFMDVISFPQEKETYRMVFTTKGKLAAIKTPENEASLKVSKITGKGTLKGGKTQLRLNDGRSLLVEKDSYAVGDSLLLELPKQTIKEHLPLKDGATVLVYKGKYAGTQGTVESIEGRSVFIKTKDANIHTRKAYTFVVGEKKPVITCSP